MLLSLAEGTEKCCTVWANRQPAPPGSFSCPHAGFGWPSTSRVNAERRMLLLFIFFLFFFISPLGLQLPACVWTPRRLGKGLAGACGWVRMGEKQDVGQTWCSVERCCAFSRALQKAPGKVFSSFLPPSGLC